MAVFVRRGTRPLTTDSRSSVLPDNACEVFVLACGAFCEARLRCPPGKDRR